MASRITNYHTSSWRIGDSLIDGVDLYLQYMQMRKLMNKWGYQEFSAKDKERFSLIKAKIRVLETDLETDPKIIQRKKNQVVRLDNLPQVLAGLIS